MGTITDFLIDTAEALTPVPEGTFRRAIDAVENTETQKIAATALEVAAGVALSATMGGAGMLAAKGLKRLAKDQDHFIVPKTLMREFVRDFISPDLCRMKDVLKLPFFIASPIVGPAAYLFLSASCAIEPRANHGEQKIREYRTFTRMPSQRAIRIMKEYEPPLEKVGIEEYLFPLITGPAFLFF